MMAQVEDEKSQTDEIDVGVGIRTNFIRTFDSIDNLSVSSLPITS
jgi:hypothetical protein